MKFHKIQARHLKRLSFEKLADQLRLDRPSEIEGSLRNLVSAISALEGIVILSSCGGFTTPDEEPGRVPDGDFFVVFFVKPSLKGFRSLGTIVEAASTVDPDNIWIRVDNMTDNPDFINFEVHGTKGVSPDDLAREIASLHDLFSKPPSVWKFLSEEYLHE